MLNKQTLSLKLNKSFQGAPDAPFTPVEQTLSTPSEPPQHQAFYFGPKPSQQPQPEVSFYAHPQFSESDDILTDVDEPASKVNKNYSISFTPVFDQLLMNIYSHIMLLPTTTPFLGYVPPLGIASRVANETLKSLMKNVHPEDVSGLPVYDTQSVLTYEQLKNASVQPIVLQLIRKRLIDLCTAQKCKSKSSTSQIPAITSVVVAVPALAGFNYQMPNQQAPGFLGQSGRQLSISNLQLNEQNIMLHQQNQYAQANQSNLSAALNSSRLRLSSLNLRKHSLTRNNSNNGSNWLHVGNIASARQNNGGLFGMNADFNASSDSLQLMSDFVPHAFIQRGNSQMNVTQNSVSGTVSGLNSMMMDYHTPPSSSKSSFSQGSTSPSTSMQRDNTSTFMPGSLSSTEADGPGPMFLRTRSLSRNGMNCPFPNPLTINTDLTQNVGMMGSQYPGLGSFNGESLNSPFVSSLTPLEEGGYFMSGAGTNGPNVLGQVLPNVGGLRNGALIPESPAKDSKINLPGQFSLSEKKRDSLKMKRGIH